MITHEEALEKYQHLITCLYDMFEVSHDFKDEYEIIKQAFAELEELKRDVKRYFELDGRYFALDKSVEAQPQCYELYNLKQKLMKVGKEQ
jgi:hypothetical protein